MISSGFIFFVRSSPSLSIIVLPSSGAVATVLNMHANSAISMSVSLVVGISVTSRRLSLPTMERKSCMIGSVSMTSNIARSSAAS